MKVLVMCVVWMLGSLTVASNTKHRLSLALTSAAEITVGVVGDEARFTRAPGRAPFILTICGVDVTAGQRALVTQAGA